ncbi:alpha/beta fold hydrolase [Streptomyces sp. NPDC058297]|uniref:alpha/beta fold hydrolase n=1 Tax=Streptomyces sp. NPDC058297 TaxID=3346433 RepID=UPI0036E8A176
MALWLLSIPTICLVQALSGSPVDVLTGQFALLPAYPRASFAVLDLAGHNLQIEQPALFAALVVRWLDRVESERTG